MDGLDLPEPPRPRSSPSTKTTVGVLVAMVIVLIVAGLGISRVRDAQQTLRHASALVTTTTTAPASGQAAPPAGADLSPEQQKVIDDVKAQVSSIRGLAWKTTLPIKVVSKDELAKRLKDLNTQDRAKHPDQLATDESVLKLLQLIPRNLDYAKAVDDLLAGGVLGFYDDEAKELYVGGNGTGPPDAATRSVLSHELTHALTDQYFDFGSKGRALDDANRTEESAALTALIEGDAELVRTMWEDKYLSAAERKQADDAGSNDNGAYAKAPPYLLDSLFFPYQDGVAFVRSRFQAGGFAAVDDAYRNPPTSTEQILHPELYTPGQGWTAPALPDLAAQTGCGKVETGTLGEFDMTEMLDRQLNSADSHSAAAGWNGDAYSVVRCGAALGLADRWQTDSPADAARLTDALTKWAKGWSGSTKAPDADGRFSGPSGAGRIVRSATGRVDLVLADDVATADRVGRVLAAA
ncbi:MAG TPA: hypothetical protein VHT97_13710 [Acidimicrobiales bacterium]|jgi:hypothetical protein|nr:hypothetical protein [Acidimicrobiales bacterium]